MSLHSSTGAIFFSSFSVRKKRQKVIQGRCDVLENPGDASRLVLGIFLFHYRTFCHRKNGLRCGVLCYIKQKLFTKVIFPSDAIVQTCTFIVETLTHFVLAQPRLVGGMGLCEKDVSVWNYNFHLKQPPSRLMRGGGSSVLLYSLYIGSGDWVKRHTLVGGLGFHLNCNLLHLNTEAEICTKRFMGPGETRRIRHKRDVNGGLIKNINGTKVS